MSLPIYLGNTSINDFFVTIRSLCNYFLIEIGNLGLSESVPASSLAQRKTILFSFWWELCFVSIVKKKLLAVSTLEASHSQRKFSVVIWSAPMVEKAYFFSVSVVLIVE